MSDAHLASTVLWYHAGRKWSDPDFGDLQAQDFCSE